MTKKSLPPPERDVERVHVVLAGKIMRQLRDEAKRDGQTLSIKIERVIQKGLAA